MDPEQCCAQPDPEVQRANVEVIKGDQPVAVVSGGVADLLDLEVCIEREETAASRGLTRDDGGPQGTQALGEQRIRPAGASHGLRRDPGSGVRAAAWLGAGAAVTRGRADGDVLAGAIARLDDDAEVLAG